ncbi:MAG: RsmE family RNA methyltransferase, partial [Pseudomonadota bacterium]
ERLRFLVEKATELGVAALVPVMTEHTSAPAPRQAKLRDWAIEAAEQCGRLSVPDCAAPQAMAAILADWDEARCLILCDESGGGKPAMAVFERGAQAPAALLVGPEGGFSEPERGLIGDVPVSVAVGLGPRILRAETAAVAALAYWQAAQGDARLNPAVARDIKDP